MDGTHVVHYFGMGGAEELSSLTSPSDMTSRR